MSAKSGLLSIIGMQLGLQKVSVIQNNGVSAIQRFLMCLSLWLNSWEFWNCLCDFGMSAAEGCPLAGFHCSVYIFILCCLFAYSTGQKFATW